jgi:hypothetical protein
MMPRANSRSFGRLAAGGVLMAGLIVRLAIFWHTSSLPPRIADELQYTQLAQSLAAGRGFAWSNGALTSLRPPLYPAMVAAIWRIAGRPSLQAVRGVQIGLSLVTAILVFALGQRLFSTRVGAIAAGITWLYPDLIFLDSLLLTETLFTLLLVTFVVLTVTLVQRPRIPLALAAGAALGLAALTRSVLWPMPFVLCPALILTLDGSWSRRIIVSGAVLAGFATAVVPWAVRNSRLQGVVTIVDTMGGMNLRMGNYEYTPEDRMWDAVSVTGDRNWVHALAEEQAAGTMPATVTEGMKDKWAQKKAIEYMRAHPGITLRRSVIKFADFWGLERSFIAGVQQGLYTPPTWLAVIASVLMVVAYVAVAVVGVLGLWLTPPVWREHLLLVLPIALLTGIHTIVFGHARYHLPLIPLLGLYGAAMLDTGFQSGFRRAAPIRFAAVASVLLLVGIWARQVIYVDGARISAALSRWWRQ